MTRVFSTRASPQGGGGRPVRRDVTVDMAKLTALSGLGAVGAAYQWGAATGLIVSVGMLGLITIALVSPAGPVMEFDNPIE